MPDIRFTRKLVINRCFGGFGLSRDAAYELARRKGWTLREEDGYILVGDGHDQVDDLVSRDDPDLIDVVETMGRAASGVSADLRVVEVVLNVDILNTDGREKVRVWGQAD